jgi:hypothetical protein
VETIKYSSFPNVVEVCFAFEAEMELISAEARNVRNIPEVLLVTVLLDSWGGVRLCPLGTSPTILPVVTAQDDERGEVGEIIGRIN